MGHIDLSKWDSEHFGIKIGRYSAHTLEDICSDIKQAKTDGYELLIARIPTDCLDIVNKLERHGFRVKDTLVRYRISLEDINFLERNVGLKIRTAAFDDIDILKEIASKTFKNYMGHFHADESLSKEKCDELYIKWAVNSITDKKIADEVLIAENDTYMLGFAAMKVVLHEESDVVLTGTASEARHRGVYSELMKEAINRSKTKKLKYISTGTQVNNYIVQNVWMKLGAKIFDSYYTLHLWLESVKE